MVEFYGVDIDSDSRCTHYNTKTDIVSIKCGICNKYYACYKCHNELEEHNFGVISRNDLAPVLCGYCNHTLTYDQYQQQMCIYCGCGFNPKCRLHENIYFTN